MPEHTEAEMAIAHEDYIECCDRYSRLSYEEDTLSARLREIAAEKLTILRDMNRLKLVMGESGDEFLGNIVFGDVERGEVNDSS